MKILSEDKSTYNNVFFQSFIMGMLIFTIPVPLLTQYSDKKKNNLKLIGLVIGIWFDLSVFLICRGTLDIVNSQLFGYIMLFSGLPSFIINVILMVKITQKNKLKNYLRLSKRSIKDDLKNFYIKYGVQLNDNDCKEIIDKLDLSTPSVITSDFTYVDINNNYFNKDLSIIYNFIPQDTPSLDEYSFKLTLNIYNISYAVKDKYGLIPKIVMPHLDDITEKDVEMLIESDKNIQVNPNYRYNYEQAALGLIVGFLEKEKSKSNKIKKIVKKIKNYAEINGYKKNKGF